MYKNSAFVIVLFYLLLTQASTLFGAAEFKDLDQGKGLAPLKLTYLEDKNKSYKIEDVTSPDLAASFTKNTSAAPNFGFTTSAYWVRIKLPVVAELQSHYLLKAKNNDWDLVEYYYQGQGLEWRKEQGGRDLPFNPAIFINNNTIFSLPNLEAPNQIVYLRFETDHYRMMTDQGMIIDLTILSTAEQQQKITELFYFQGVFYGVFLIMILYNIFLFSSIRDKSYLFYSCYLAPLIPFFMIFDGLLTPFFWSPTDLENEGKMISLTFSIFSVFYILFVKSFLQTDKNTPKLDRILSFSMYFTAFGALAAVAFPRLSVVIAQISAANTIVMFLAVFSVGVLCFLRGYKPAFYFLLASSSFLVLTTVATFATFPMFLFLAPYSIFMVKAGVLVESVLYSFALAERFKYERKLKEESQDLAIENLEKSNRIKDEFLANTSHELRTPLHGIIGLAEATLENFERVSSSKFQSNLSLIVSSGRRLSLLVNDILDLSKLKHKEIPLQLQPVELGRLIESVCALSEPLIGGKPVTLVHSISASKPIFVQADEARLEQILYNIIGNAIKFTAQGTVTIEAKETDQYITISVADTGMGIPPDKQAEIFNAFEQLDGSIEREAHGTGLGLSIVKQLVELHQSHLELQSTLDEGSVFSFKLPVVLAVGNSPSLPGVKGEEGLEDLNIEAQDLEAATLEISKIAQSTLKGFINILIVDDDPLNIEVIAQQLSAKDYQLRVAMNGADALAEIESEKPDLILLDVMMPKMSGFEVCEIVRAKYQQNQLPIIFLTAKNREADVLKGLEIGGNDYLTKPFFRSELIQRVANQLEIAQFQMQSETLKSFANKISQYTSQEEMMQEAFGQIAQCSFVDEAAWFEGEEVLFSFNLGQDGKNILEQAPTRAIFKELNLAQGKAQTLVVNSVLESHILGKFYQPGHYLFIFPQHLPGQLILLYRKPERTPFDQSKAAVYAQGMINQIQTTQKNLEALFGDDKLVSVIGQVQPRLHEITHVKSASPTLELYFDSDTRPQFIDGCSLDKLSLYFSEGQLIRVHKSYLVNGAKVTKLHKTAKSRDLNLELTSGEIIPAGRTYMEKIRQIFPHLA